MNVSCELNPAQLEKLLRDAVLQSQRSLVDRSASLAVADRVPHKVAHVVGIDDCFKSQALQAAALDVGIDIYGIDDVNTDWKASLQQRYESARRFSPSLSYGRHFGPPMHDARYAAVMILLEPSDSGWTIPLTVRPNHLPDHPGQVCLPGGRLEAGESAAQAAEREFCEELGFTRFPSQTIGSLQSIYVYNSNFYLTPCVAIASQPQTYSPNPEEVEQVVHMPLAHLMDLDHHIVKAHRRGRVGWTALGIEVGGVHVWGATAIVLGDLAAVLQQMKL